MKCREICSCIKVMALVVSFFSIQSSECMLPSNMIKYSYLKKNKTEHHSSISLYTYILSSEIKYNIVVTSTAKIFYVAVKNALVGTFSKSQKSLWRRKLSR